MLGGVTRHEWYASSPRGLLELTACREQAGGAEAMPWRAGESAITNAFWDPRCSHLTQRARDGRSRAMHDHRVRTLRIADGSTLSSDRSARFFDPYVTEQVFRLLGKLAPWGNDVGRRHQPSSNTGLQPISGIEKNERCFDNKTASAGRECPGSCLVSKALRQTGKIFAAQSSCLLHAAIRGNRKRHIHSGVVGACIRKRPDERFPTTS